MFMFFLLYGIYAFCLVIMHFSSQLYGKPQQNVILETTLADEFIGQPAVTAVVRHYQKQLRHYSLAALALGLPLAVMPYESIRMIYMLLLLFLSIGGYQYVLIGNISRMQALKREQQWFHSQSQPAKIRVETKLTLTKNRQLVKLWWFIPPAAVSAALCLASLLGRVNIWFGLSSLAMASLVGLLYYAVVRLPAKVLTTDSTLNRYCNDLVKHHWSLLVLGTAYYLSALQASLWYSLQSSMTGLTYLSLFLVLASLGLMGLTLYLLLNLRHKQNLALSQSEKYYYEEADQYWQYGIYLNPHDPRLMVPDRVGLNITLNLGLKAGKRLALVFASLLSAVLLLTFTLMLRADFAKNVFTMTFDSQGIVLVAPFAPKKEIAFSEMQQVERLTSLPTAQRLVGAETEHYATGKFKVAGTETESFFYVNYQSALYLKITTPQTTYYFSNRTTEQTEQSYERLLKQLK